MTFLYQMGLSTLLNQRIKYALMYSLFILPLAIQAQVTYFFCPNDTFELKVSATAVNGGTIQWYKDNIAIAGATDTLYNVVALGTYHVIVTNGTCSLDGCDTLQFVPCPTGTIGNYVWTDTDGDGLQDAGETGLNGITVELYKETAPGSGIYTLVQTTTTVTNAGNDGYYNFTVTESANYYVHFPTTNAVNILTTATTTAATDGNSDANTSTGNSPIFAIDVNGIGTAKNNTTIDAGFKGIGSVGNYVWNDTDADGTQDVSEIGINGVLVELWSAGLNGIIGGGDDVMIADTLTATNAGNAGYYHFIVNLGGNYYVHFPINAITSLIPTTQTTTAATDGNSDADVSGNSPVFAIDINGTGAAKDNPTIDAGYKCNTSVSITAQTNILCFGASTGSATALAINGASPYTYTWSTTPAQYGTNATGLSAGTYSVTTVDANSCSATTNVTITEPAVMSANITTQTNVLCFGASTGTATASATGGTGSFTYTWNTTPAQYGTNATGLAAGTYTVTAVDANNCSATANVTITQPAAISPSPSQVNVSAFGATDGSASVSVTGGVSPYTYTWNTTPTQYGATATNLGVGTYVVTVVDANGCQATASITIIQPAKLGDFVWLDADKDGVQDANEPGVSGVIVTLYDNSGNPVATTVTDAYGYYVFNRVAAGTYTVGFTLPIDYVFAPKDNAGNDNTDSDVNLGTGKTDAIVVNNGDNITNIDAGVHYTTPLKSLLGDYVWYDDNGNGIQDGSERGVSGVTVTLYNNAGNAVMSTVTDGNGAYHFLIFASGNYSVGFALPIGYTFTTPNNTTDNNDSDAGNTAGAGFGKTAQVSVVLGTDILTLDAGIIAAPSTTASIGDYVWYDLNQDGIQDANEKGISGVTVILKDQTGATIATTTTDILGYYIFNNVPAGTYSVTFTSPSGYTFSLANNGNGTNDSDANATDGTTPLFTVRGGDVRTDIDAGLFQSTSITNAALGNYVWFDGNKNGTQDANESGVAGVTVTLLNASGAAIATTMTDAAGLYLFPNLAAGIYSVKFSNLPQAYVFTSENVGAEGTDSDALSNGESNTVTLVAGDRYLDLDAGIHLGGTSGGNGSMGDFVWNDLNGNGVQDIGEPGIGGIVVTLYGSDGTTVIATTTTDAAGNYLFTNLPSGTYYLSFSNLPAGFSFITANQGTNDLTDSDVDNTGKTGAISLGEGENKVSVDAGLQNTTNTGSIGDFVWNDKNGNGIQDVTEVGMPNVVVTLYNASGNPIATTVTDENGFYIFPNLPTGTYSIGFSGLPNGYSFSPTGQGTSGTGSDANPSTGITNPFTLNTGENKTDIDAGLISTRAMIGNFVWEDLDRDGVQDLGEPSISGVTVTLYDNANNPVAQAITDAKGEYYFVNINPGTYTIIFSTIPANMEFTTANATADDLDSDAGANGLIPIFTVAAGDVNLTFDAGLVTPAKGGLTGYVWYDKDKDGIQDTGELPTGGVTVTLYASNGTTVIATTITAGNGQYVFDNLPLGNYIIGFSTLPNGYALTNPNVGSDDSIDSDANLISAQSGIYTVLEGIKTEAADAGLVKPTQKIGDFVWKDNDKDGIQDAGEPGVAGVTVTLYTSIGDVVSVVKTDALGHYLFQDVPAGNYEIGFSLPIDYVFSPTTGGNESTDNDADNTGRTGNFTVITGTDSLGIDAGIYFQQNTIAGLGNYIWLDTNADGIQDASERGVSNVTVTLFDAAGTAIQTTLSDQNGLYQFQNLSPNDYAVGFTLPIGYTFTQQDATSDANDSDVNPTTGRTIVTTLSAGEQDMTWDAGIALQAPEKASVGDFVWNDWNHNGLQEAGEPGVGGVEVDLYDELGTLLATTYTDAFGNYLFTDVTAGAYYISFMKPTAYTISAQNQGTNDETDSDIDNSGKTAIFKVSPGDRITDIDAGIYLTSPAGTAALGDYVWFDANNNGLQDANERGVGGITVTLLNASQNPIANTVTDVTGYYFFANLAQTNYYIRFSNLPSGYSFTNKDAGADANDSDVNKGNGQTDIINLNVALNVTIDAGLVIQASEGGKGSIGDYVWYDANRDGIQDANEKGISGVVVTLTNITTTTTETLNTDGLGYYLFNNLEEGQYQVSFSLPAGYSFSPLNIGNDNTDSDADNTGNSPIFILGQGETNVSIDAGIYKTAITNPAALGDRVWLDTDRNGTQDIGEIGVAGVSVNLFDTNMTAIAATATDANGYYIFNGLNAGIYTVAFTNLPNGYIFTAKDKTADSQDSDADSNTGFTNAIILTAGQVRTDIDAGIYSNTKAALGNYVWYDTDNDGIQNNSPEGVSAVTVILYDAGNVALASTITDVNGYYFFPNLDANTYTVGFSTLPNGAHLTLQDIGTDDTDSDADALGHSSPLALAAGEVNLSLDAGIGSSLPASLYGYVWYDYQNMIVATNNNGIQNNGETPVSGVTVSLLDASNNLVATAITGAKGTYLFDNLIPSSYTIQFATIPNGVKWTTSNQGGNDMLDSDAIPTGATTADGGTYTVLAGENKEAADAGLIPPASLSGMAFMDGKANFVNTADGIRNYQDPNDNASGADASLNAVLVLLLDENKNVLRSMRTGEDGTYIFRGLESGKKYWVAFESFPSGCATCDFTSHNVSATNDSTDSDVDTSKVITYNAKTFMLTDSIDGLLPFAHRPNIDAGYRQPGSVFPIELLALTAVWQGQDGLVKWTTATESNSAHFGVERSLDGGKTFSWLGNVLAAGYSMSPKNYTFTDMGIAGQTDNKVYYRLKLVDLDATYKYSEKVELMKGTGESEIYFNVYPNPTKDVIHIDYHVNGTNRIEFRLVNALGQVIFAEIIENQDMPKTIFFDLRDYSSGAYIIQLNTSSQTFSRKIVKE